MMINHNLAYATVYQDAQDEKLLSTQQCQYKKQ